jgi:hypothetical protein
LLTFDFAQISLNFLISNKLKLKGIKLEVMRNKGPSLYKEERIKEKKIERKKWSLEPRCDSFSATCHPRMTDLTR